MKSYGDINFLDNEIQRAVLQLETDFPPNPKVGRLVFKNKRVYICVENTGLPVWVPLTSEIDMYIHVQDVAATTWTIQHNLNTTTPMVQIYDTTHKMFLPDTVEAIDNNTVRVTLSSAVRGRAVVLVGNDIGGTDRREIVYSYKHIQTNLATTWEINHGLGYEPIVRVFINNEEVQPVSIVHLDKFNVQITFSQPQVGEARLI